ncbi:MAG: M20/M25/M40 family metallo-hydrolase, partial [Gammaproteobacteria bacterium]
TLPMAERKDALFAANEMISALRQNLDVDDIKFTIGLFDVSPNAPSVVPASVRFSIDLRHPDVTVLRDTGDSITEICESNSGPCTVAVSEIASDESLEFPEEIRSRISDTADELEIASMPILSLAGHDARPLHYHCPSGMIFAPCEHGISHHEAENAKPSDLAAATRVLAATIAGMADAASG